MAHADALEATSISLPAISTGAYHYPPVQAAEIALAEVMARLAGSSTVRQATFVLRSIALAETFQRLARRMERSRPGG